ncbi:class I SAM-dependent RNA methyltransferase [Acuticoccus sp. I52.16.1]|uniref:class I SAM-dependent RNA methyltransferase n=1 Tax=Acuticoccus sp. I52.16.1 TaxID=2928472 RepID=UPI001FD38C7F|nr:hypothetical protein [Acuticoccus sp. I52.16.1]UOM33326.1 hypothetical protein MRB58_15840 [Acuticoccus sp. I52.16.1]
MSCAPVGTCALFGRCGGCSALDRPADVYAAGKRDAVVAALAARGIEAEVAPLERMPFASRRRATFTAVSDRDGTRVGYQAARSHEVIDVAACPALDPALAAALPEIRSLGTAAASGGRARLTATLCDNGIDLAITRERAKPAKGPKGRRRSKADKARPLLVEAQSLLRVTVDGELAIMREPPLVRFDGVDVPFPPAAFLQASRASEARMTELVLAGVGAAGTVADLFCGLGTFAVPLTRQAKVLAAELDGPALDALEAGMGRTAGRRGLTAERRNLMHHPLGAKELTMEAVVFDPPRAGAEAQAVALAQTRVPRVVAVSCEPRTLARDLAILVAGGYKITQVVPVDQFVGTDHIEVIATLE